MRHLLEYGGVRLLEWSLSLLPWRGAIEFGSLLGILASRVLSKKRRLTRENLQNAFPKLEAREIRKLTQEVWANVGKTAAEFAKARHISRESLLELAPVENMPYLRQALSEGRGALLHSGHLANWEIAGMSLSAQGIPLMVVARSIKNPYLDRWVNAGRILYGMELILHRNPFFPIVRALRRGRAVAILMDQNMPSGGIFAPFFGRPAATSPLTALLAAKVGSPILPVLVRREGRRIITRIEKPLQIRQAGEETVQALVRELTQILEESIRQRPAEWLWIHNRWKRAREATP